MNAVLEVMGWLFELTAETVVEAAPEVAVRFFVDLAFEPIPNDTTGVHERYLGRGPKYLSINDC